MGYAQIPYMGEQIETKPPMLLRCITPYKQRGHSLLFHSPPTSPPSALHRIAEGEALHYVVANSPCRLAKKSK
jgi:hypothetical protein